MKTPDVAFLDVSSHRTAAEGSVHGGMESSSYERNNCHYIHILISFTFSLSNRNKLCEKLFDLPGNFYAIPLPLSHRFFVISLTFQVILSLQHIVHTLV